MKTKCIFKCFAQDEWWYVYETNIGVLLSNYRVYKGRKWYGHIAFQYKQDAIAAVIIAVTNRMEGCNLKVEALR